MGEARVVSPPANGEREGGFGAGHPFVDLVTGHRAIAFARRDPVALSSAMADAVARFPEQERVLTLVTAPGVRVTLPVRELASERVLHWIAQVGEDEFFDGLSGQPLSFVDGDFLPAADGVSAHFEAATPPTHWQLLAVFTAEHRASTQTRLGGAVEAIAAHLTGAAPTGWGPVEPVSEAWDRDAYTAFVRSRMPGDTRCVVVGATGSLVASSLVRRTDRGVEEQVIALASAGPVSRPVEQVRASCVEALRAASDADTMGFGWVLLRPGEESLSEAPRRRATPVPLAMVIGPRAVRALAKETLLTTPLGEPEQVGRPRTPGLLWGLGENGHAPWEQLAEFVAHVGPQRLAEAAPQLLEGP